MSTRFLAGLLALAITWISLFTFEPGHIDVQERADVAVTLAPPEPGSIVDHHLDDQPLQSADSAVDLPDHQPISQYTAAPAQLPALALSGDFPRCTTVFLDGLLRPPTCAPLQA